MRLVVVVFVAHKIALNHLLSHHSTHNCLSAALYSISIAIHALDDHQMQLESDLWTIERTVGEILLNSRNPYVQRIVARNRSLSYDSNSTNRAIGVHYCLQMLCPRVN